MINTKSVLIISNDPDLNSRLDSVLREPEYRLNYMRRADKNLRPVIKRLKPDLIVIDPEIPELRGIALSLLLRQWSQVPILMLSAEKTLENEVRALDMDALDYLSEPFDVGIVSVRVDDILSPSHSG